MKKVRFGIIGVGNIGTVHARYLLAGKVEEACLTAVCDNNPDKHAAIRRLTGESVALFSDAREMLESGLIDAVIVATPHYDHPALSIMAMRRGIHTLCEKPAGVYTAQVEEMNACARECDVVFSMMYNQRPNPLYQKVKDLIDSGELGELRRSNWIITNWYRSQSYYNSGGWRATWKGEGGGVLLNQDPHQLDLWQWLVGMPVRMRAFCQFGKHRQIEVENEVTAYAEYANGATGVFITTTAEAPGTNRLEIAGDRGKVVVEEGRLRFWRLRESETEFNARWQNGFGEPECWEVTIPTAAECSEHDVITRNFTAAILHGEPLIAPGLEGIRGLTLSNAMHLSTWIDDWVAFPFDEQRYYQLLQERIASSVEKHVASRTLDASGTW
ncbi:MULTISPECIES: Gfo/Idh/MocA family protein [Citrobacter]|uniref:Gfo/Idh/MocA family oxidoreductase n=1 Tax=Citrobacter sedlakii TaxID=67826 RepID=A0ABS0ZW66_9ENTR|nr:MULTISPECIES: Gfo/Idh/MocA family oxidoreductase [Citrobacter]EHG7582652.1 Gfo/Idh/MocA family oxidoreductase [Citrobacter sedlakii]EIQ7158161.1 Gfo/Idh/MocA family oxidoreductase [Citrobacter sedlakii]KSY26099.1 oxidoreductase [Citrobacter sp. 50677481]MBJ8382589.1 Gfo/Idh/MocA family oxidoreductase [Citrobacter sedlakii]MBN6597165.1 Gfo/Idh/MocA family oxidoreductase [Citrobacter sedlakii]